MLLKRLYDLSDPDNPVVNGVRVLRAKDRQRFSPDMVAKATAQGWLVLSDGKITLKAENGSIVYRIMRVSGYYCCHCQAAMADGAASRAHIEKEHAKKTSPDPCNPAGYERIHYFDCVKAD
jgi:hypothetical protein